PRPGNHSAQVRPRRSDDDARSPSPAQKYPSKLPALHIRAHLTVSWSRLVLSSVMSGLRFVCSPRPVARVPLAPAQTGECHQAGTKVKGRGRTGNGLADRADNDAEKLQRE